MKPLPVSDLEHIHDRTRDLWHAARDKRIFLSGATGFFGLWLLESLAYCNRLLDLGLSATVLCRNPGAVRMRFPHLTHQQSIRFWQGDIRTLSFPDDSFDFMIHAAAPTTSDPSVGPNELLSIIIDGTRNMIEFAKRCGVRRFLFVSSGAVYGPQPEGIKHIPEDYQGGPNWLDPSAAYAEGKRIAEQLCNIASQETGIHFAIARCFAFVGPHLPLDQHFAIGNFIADALAGKTIMIRGNGTPLRSYLYAADLAIWLWTLLLSDPHPPSNPAVVNVGSEEAISIRELATEVIKALNVSLRYEIAERAVANGRLLQYVPDVSRARDWFGLRQSIELRDAIQRTAAWHIG